MLFDEKVVARIEINFAVQPSFDVLTYYLVAFIPGIYSEQLPQAVVGK